MKHHVGYTQNNASVHVDLIGSEAGRRISREPHLLSLVSEMIQGVQLKKDTINLEYDMGRPIGYDLVVETEGTDNIFYAKLIRDPLYTRFKKNGDPLTTQYLSLHLRQGQDGYDLFDVRIGRITPPRPGAPEETPESRIYWGNHAFVFENQPIQSNTTTKDCPY